MDLCFFLTGARFVGLAYQDNLFTSCHKNLLEMLIYKNNVGIKCDNFELSRQERWVHLSHLAF